MIAVKLTEAIRLVCPIHGVSIVHADDRATWRIDFKDEATTEQRAAAQVVLAGFDIAAADAPPTQAELENDALAALNGGSGRIDLQKLLKALVISSLAHRLGKPPGQLTAAELLAERTRIAAIYKAL